MSQKPTTPSLSVLFFLSTLTLQSFLGNHAEAQVEAYVGQPFGVGRIVLRIPEGELPEPLGAEGIELTDAEGRTFYPVVEAPPDTALVRKLLLESPLLQGGPVRQEAAGIIQGFLDQTPPTTIYFLFRGDSPLHLTIGTKTPRHLTIRPLRSQPGLDQVASAWWKQYTSRPKKILGLKKWDYPPVVRNYLESMLSLRLGLELPPVDEKDPTQAMLEEQLGLMLGTEQIQTAMIRDRMLGDASLSEKANLPLPVAQEWPPLPELQAAKNVEVEPIAMRVPEECFYIRFGNYANFLWMQDTMKRWGGDAGNLISLRGLDYETTRRMEEHLIVKQTVLGRMLGGTMVSDVAMIGTDLFLREGASFGLLFEARNTFMLDREFAAQRAARVEEGGVTEETVEIDGKKVSFIHSEDDKVRSFYLADNGYIFITSSKEVMRRFIATGKKEPVGALGATREFQHARTVMPTVRDDTVFVYFSDAFFRNMASPHYWVEMRRRLQAVADIEVLELARLAGVGEGFLKQTSKDQLDQALLQQEITILKEQKLLSENFGPRPDGSEVVLDSQGRLVDSLRGRRGFFVPIPDLPVEKITTAEAAAYHRFLSFYHEKWGRLDPMIVGIRREDLGKGEDRITVDAQANPFDKKHYETLIRRTGPAEQRRLAPVEGNIIDFQVVLPDQYLFVGLQDVQLPSLADDATSDRQSPDRPNSDIQPQARTAYYAPDPGRPYAPAGRGRGLLGGRLRQTLTAPGPSFAPAAQSPGARPRVGLFDIFVGYIGTTGDLGLLSLFQALVMPAERIPGQTPDMNQGPQLHKINSGQFTLFSFQNWLLEQVRPQLHFVEAERPAQLRLDVGDVARAKITPTLNRLSYARTRTTSLGNLRLLQSLEQQLRVQAKACLDVAETLLDAKLICPLGGKYELRRVDGNESEWISTAIRPVRDASPLEIPVPEDYVGPPLNWFRGLKLNATMTPEIFSTHAELIMKLPK